MNLTIERETTIRDFLVTKAASVLDVPVMRTRKLFQSAQDFATRNSLMYEAAFKCSYFMIAFASFRDDATRGCDDDPVTYITYMMQLYRDSQEEKIGKINSHDQLVVDTINLRNIFLENRSILDNKIEHQALVQVGEMVKVQPCEHIVGTVGDWLNFRLTVEVNS